MKKKKQQLCIQMPSFLVDELKRTAKMRRTTHSTIVETALKGLLSQTENDAVIDRRLNRLHHQYERMHKDQQILIETLASFVKVYLTHTPVISKEQKNEAEILGAERFDRFIGIIQKAFVENQSFSDVVKEKVFSEEDFETGVEQ